MTDEEVERRYHELQLQKLSKLVTSLPVPKVTDRVYYSTVCERCNGTGRLPQKTRG